MSEKSKIVYILSDDEIQHIYELSNLSFDEKWLRWRFKDKTVGLIMRKDFIMLNVRYIHKIYYLNLRII